MRYVSSQNGKKGFTLIELMVSIGIFALVITLITGAYLEILATAFQAQATITATDNLAFVLENMTRLVRTGTSYTCGTTVSTTGQDCESGGAAFSFKDIDGNEVTYSIPPGESYIQEHIKYRLGSNGLPPGPELDYRITESSITISSLTFIVTGSSPTDELTPMVVLAIRGTVPGTKGSTLTFSLETLATMRGIDQ